MPDKPDKAAGNAEEERKRQLSRHIKGAKRYQREGYDVQEYVWDNDLPEDLAKEVQDAVPPRRERRERKGKGGEGAARRMFPDFQ